ncbi:hypothetical protein [Endozoicomonas sp. ALB091]|uniref:hypothetical protein n=1 Tax=Endozoicomonas sp. ALB091 TaxID=3403073 RepID=UPI003BB783D4
MKLQLLTVAIVGTALITGCAVSSHHSLEKHEKVAQAPEVSGIEYDNMDSSVRPQDDFYRYVNGQWLDKTEIPEDKSRYGAFSKLYDARQSEVNALYVSQSGLGLPDRDYYLEEGERYKAIRQQ